MRVFGVAFLLGFLCAGSTAWAEERVSLAVAAFDAKDAKPFEGYQEPALMDLLSAELSSYPALRLVERSSLKALLDEKALSLAGFSAGDTAAAKLAGVDAWIRARAFSAGGKLIVTAKIIRTHTSAVDTVVEDSAGTVSESLKQIASKIARRVSEKPADYLIPPSAASSPAAELKKVLAGRQLPDLVFVPDLRVEDASASLSAARSAVWVYSSAGLAAVYVDVAPAVGKDSVTVTVTAESRIGLRTGDLVTASARVKLEAVDSGTKRPLASSSGEQKAVDVTAKNAAAQALDKAAAQAAVSLGEALAGAWSSNR